MEIHESSIIRMSDHDLINLEEKGIEMFTVKIVHESNDPFGESEKSFSLYSDVRSFTTPSKENPKLTLRILEPSRNPGIPGITETEIHVDPGEVTYVMNSTGKTVAIYRLKRP